MERKANINANNSLASFFTTEEIELSKVLLQLSYPVILSEHKHNVWKVGWGSTKKRSIPPLEPNNVALVCCRPPPLPGDSGEKPPKSSKPRRRRREHWLEKINELTERRELLKKEVGKVGAYYEKLKAINSELKARKQELKPTLIMDFPADVDVSNEVKSQGFDLDVAKKILTKAMCAEARKTKDYFPVSTPRYPLGIDE